jgi:hypothetical protein
MDYRKRQQEQAQSEQAQQQIKGLIGQKGQQFEQAGPMQPGVERQQLQGQGTGLIGGQIAPSEFYARAMAIPGYEQIGATGLQGVMSDQAKTAEGSTPFAGSGMDAQTYNQIIAYQIKKQSGQPTTPQEDMAYSLASQRATRPSRYTTPEGTMWEQPGISLKDIISPQSQQQPATIGVQPAPQPPSRPEREQIGERKFTEGQNLAAGFADRMTLASETADKLTSAGYDPSNIKDQAAGRMGITGNFMMTPQGQQYKQAQEDWVRAKLRKESGAVISPDEMNDEISTYFPQAGDGPEVLAQKKIARQTAERAMVKQSAGAYTAPAISASDAEYEALKNKWLSK